MSSCTVIDPRLLLYFDTQLWGPRTIGHKNNELKELILHISINCSGIMEQEIYFCVSVALDKTKNSRALAPGIILLSRTL